MKTRQWLLVGAVVVVALVLLAGMRVALAAPSGPEAQPGTVVGSALLPVYAHDGVLTATAYSDPVRVRFYNSFDLFATVDLSTTGQVVVTPQFSADGVSFADAYYVSEGWVITSTRSSANVTYAMTLAADGTTYIRNIPVSGLWMRVKVVGSGNVITDGAEILIQAVARNN